MYALREFSATSTSARLPRRRCRLERQRLRRNAATRQLAHRVEPLSKPALHRVAPRVRLLQLRERARVLELERPPAATVDHLEARPALARLLPNPRSHLTRLPTSQQLVCRLTADAGRLRHLRHRAATAMRHEQPLEFLTRTVDLQHCPITALAVRPNLSCVFVSMPVSIADTVNGTDATRRHAQCRSLEERQPVPRLTYTLRSPSIVTLGSCRISASAAGRETPVSAMIRRQSTSSGSGSLTAP